MWVTVSRNPLPAFSLQGSMARYLLRTLTHSSFPSIGASFNKDHSTVMSSVRKIETMREVDEQLRHQLTELTARLGVV